MVAVKVVWIGRQDRDVPEALVIDVAAIKVRRRGWDAEVGVGGITAGDASSWVDALLLFKHGRE
jgi:hypothetical protein